MVDTLSFWKIQTHSLNRAGYLLFLCNPRGLLLRLATYMLILVLRQCYSTKLPLKSRIICVLTSNWKLWYIINFPNPNIRYVPPLSIFINISSKTQGKLAYLRMQHVYLFNICRWRLKNQRHDCLLNRLFRRWSRKTSKLWPLCGEFTGDRWFPRAKWPVTRKMFPFDDVIIGWFLVIWYICYLGPVSNMV